MYHHIQFSFADRQAILTLNRPDQCNALSCDMIAEIEQALTELDQRQDISVLVIQAAGKVFSAGHDLKEISECREKVFYDDLFSNCAKMMLHIRQLRQVVIAKIQGTATAAGCQLVASCDLAISADHAHFATPGVNIGLFCSTPMVPLSRNVAPKHSLEMLFTGKPINAETALKWGLINQSVPADQLDSCCAELVDTLVQKSPQTLATGKQAFYRQSTMSEEEAYTYCAQIMAENMMHQDAQEGVTAFLEKRQPNWPSCCENQ